MKKFSTFTSTFSLIIALFLLVAFQSCKKNDVLEVAAAETDNIAALIQAVAASNGVSADKVEYLKNEKEFVVDGDAIVSLQDAKARFSDKGVAGAVNGATQMHYNYLINSSRVNTIKIYADATVPAMWIAALDSAIANWNGSGSNVHMERITTSTGATTKVTTTHTASTTAATADYPDARGNAGAKITINTYQNNLSAAKKVFAITHELGHTLGLSHTNGTYGSLINGTPASDPNSVMNSVCLNWAGFTSYDLQAIRILYPKGASGSEASQESLLQSSLNKRFAIINRKN
jgi:hypothetical protein